MPHCGKTPDEAALPSDYRRRHRRGDDQRARVAGTGHDAFFGAPPRRTPSVTAARRSGRYSSATTMPPARTTRLGLSRLAMVATERPAYSARVPRSHCALASPEPVPAGRAAAIRPSSGSDRCAFPDAGTPSARARSTSAASLATADRQADAAPAHRALYPAHRQMLDAAGRRRGPAVHGAVNDHGGAEDVPEQDVHERVHRAPGPGSQLVEVSRNSSRICTWPASTAEPLAGRRLRRPVVRQGPLDGVLRCPDVGRSPGWAPTWLGAAASTRPRVPACASVPASPSTPTTSIIGMAGMAAAIYTVQIPLGLGAEELLATEPAVEGRRLSQPGPALRRPDRGRLGETRPTRVRRCDPQHPGQC